jgi:tetratricopeptide (TPR) repeat protein
MTNNRIEQLKQILSANTGDSLTRYMLALEYRELGETEKCRELFEQIIAADPSYTAVYYHLGKLYEDMGRRDDAEETYIKGLQMVKNKTGSEYKELEGALELLRE